MCSEKQLYRFCRQWFHLTACLSSKDSTRFWRLEILWIAPCSSQKKKTLHNYKDQTAFGLVWSWILLLTFSFRRIMRKVATREKCAASNSPAVLQISQMPAARMARFHKRTKIPQI
ncbi:hypothetical protein SUGI_0069910 [Cryptomeria japonica]|nr:hypothetical protein SUGI_0069910 [Cryptomeria japonica]